MGMIRNVYRIYGKSRETERVSRAQRAKTVKKVKEQITSKRCKVSSNLGTVVRACSYTNPSSVLTPNHVHILHACFDHQVIPHLQLSSRIHTHALCKHSISSRFILEIKHWVLGLGDYLVHWRPRYLNSALSSLSDDVLYFVSKYRYYIFLLEYYIHIPFNIPPVQLNACAYDNLGCIQCYWRFLDPTSTMLSGQKSFRNWILDKNTLQIIPLNLTKFANVTSIGVQIIKSIPNNWVTCRLLRSQ